MNPVCIVCMGVCVCQREGELPGRIQLEAITIMTGFQIGRTRLCDVCSPAHKPVGWTLKRNRKEVRHNVKNKQTKYKWLFLLRGDWHL